MTCHEARLGVPCRKVLGCRERRSSVQGCCSHTQRQLTSVNRLVVNYHGGTSDDHDERSVLERLVQLQTFALLLRVGRDWLEEQDA